MIITIAGNMNFLRLLVWYIDTYIFEVARCVYCVEKREEWEGGGSGEWGEGWGREE